MFGDVFGKKWCFGVFCGCWVVDGWSMDGGWWMDQQLFVGSEK
jgi:hypothetical protein